MAQQQLKKVRGCRIETSGDRQALYRSLRPSVTLLLFLLRNSPLRGVFLRQLTSSYIVMPSHFQLSLARLVLPAGEPYHVDLRHVRL
jgi:hypothetical protein